MHKRAFVDNYRGLDLYRKMGYIPCDLEEESVSKTLEYVCV
jgi:putative alpha-1,2-mannosidase